MRATRNVGPWLLLAFVMTACGAAPITMRQSTRSFTDRDYKAVYKAWTRDADEFSVGKLKDVLNVTATFQSWEFRWAYVVRFAQDNSLGTDARTAMLQSSLDDTKVRHRFFITLGGNNFDESDMTSERAAWRVLLVDPKGNHYVPLEMERVRKPTPADRAYFPSVSPFRQTFKVSFDAKGKDGLPILSDGTPYVILRFTGPEGVVDLRWDFQTASGK